MAQLRRRRSDVISVDGDSAIIANFYAANRRVQTAVRRVVQADGHESYYLAYWAAPKDTWFMADAHELEFTDGGFRYTVFVHPDIFMAEGLDYYPLYVHFGTRLMPARPWLRATYDLMAPRHRANVAAAIRAVLR